MSTVTQTITQLPAAPSVGSTNFDIDAERFTKVLPNFGIELNTFAAQVNVVVAEFGPVMETLSVIPPATIVAAAATATTKASEAATSAASAAVYAANSGVMTAMRDTLGRFPGILLPALNPFSKNSTTDTAPIGTFARSAPGTRMGPTGVIESVASGLVRREWDAGGNILGWLSEGQRTNIFLNTAAPANQSFSVTAQQYSFSFYGTGSITLSGAHSAVISGNTDGTRKTYTFTPSSGTLSVAISGTITSPQLEAGEFATSYTPTTDSPVVRPSDVWTIPTSAFLFNANEGTIFVSARTAPGLLQENAGNQGLFMLSDGSWANGIHVARNPLGDIYVMAYFSGTYALKNMGNVQNSTNFRLAVSFNNASLKCCINGGAIHSRTISMPSGLTDLKLGTNWSGGESWNGHLLQFTEFPRAITESALQMITA